MISLEQYLADGVTGILRDALRATLSDPRESAFFSSFALAAKKAETLRRTYAQAGTHIPPFLIASITSQCNLHCVGCYARSNHACHDGCATDQLTTAEWTNLFAQAEQLGVSFLLLAGGEPLVRRDVVKAAAHCKKLLFPIFTNGTLLTTDYIELFDRHRNLVPVLSIEGDKSRTDQRRGAGVYQKLCAATERLQAKHLMFGVSVTVTRENLEEVTGRPFVEWLRDAGCRLIFYVEYVPVDTATRELAPDAAQRALLAERVETLRAADQTMLFLSFPGDEKASGGCLAAGRGFFHINSHGGAEPCPFSPYSDVNVRDLSLLDVIRSPLFSQLRETACLDGEHLGGCVLFEKRDDVQALLETHS